MAFTVHQPPKKIVQASRLCMIDTSDEPEFLFAAAYERSGDSPAAMAPQPAAAALRPEISRISKVGKRCLEQQNAC